MSFVAVRSREQIELLASLARDIWGVHYPPIIGSAQTSYMLEHFHSEASIGRQVEDGELEYFLVRKAGAWLGYLAYGFDGADCLLSKLYVHQDQQGRGLGRQGLEFVRSKAVAAGCTSIVLGVNRHNFQALAAYLSWGFEVERTQVTDIGQGYLMDDYILSLKL